VNRCSAPLSALHSSVFARLASGAFYETIVLMNFCEFIKNSPAAMRTLEGALQQGKICADEFP